MYKLCYGILLQKPEWSKATWELGGVQRMENKKLLGLDADQELQMRAPVQDGCGTFIPSVNMGPPCLSAQ